MSKIEELRNSEKNQLNLIKIFEKLFPEKKTKYYELISRFVGEHFGMILKRQSNINRLNEFDVDGLNDVEKVFLLFFTAKIMSLDEIKEFNYFCEKHDTNAIKADLQNLDYGEISTLCDESKTSEEFKKRQNQNIKLYEDDEWLVIIPLSYESSVKYGYGTKWCTASEDTSDSFDSYTSDGTLIYIINRKSNEKHAIFHEIRNPSSNCSDITLWNSEDECIEIFFSRLPEIVLSPIRNFLYTNEETNEEMYERLYDQVDDEEVEDNEIEYDNDEELDDLGDKSEEDEEDDDVGRTFYDIESNGLNTTKIYNSDGSFEEVKRSYRSPFWEALRRTNSF